MRILFLLAGRTESDAVKLIDNIPTPNLICKSLFSLAVTDSSTKFSNSRSVANSLLFGALKNKFSSGETVFLCSDNTINDMPSWVKLAHLYEYKICIIIRDTVSKKSQVKLEKLASTLKVEIIDKPMLQDMLFAKVDDLSEYGSVLVIGDVHGCVDPLKQLINLAGDFSVGHTIFLGDLFDRGPHNVEVFNLVHKKVKSGKATLLRGNHEDHLAEIILRNSKRFSNTQKTLRQFKDAGLSSKKILSLIGNTCSFKAFSMFGQTFWASHGGAASEITTSDSGRPWLGSVPEKYFMYGEPVNNRNHVRNSKICEVDRILSQHHIETGIVHLHGHRNYSTEVSTLPGVYNLESDVDSGGFLSGVVIHPGGETVLQVAT